MASCKVSPIVSVKHIDIYDFLPRVELSVSIEGATSTLIKDKNLSQYFTAVCVLSIYDPSSGAMVAPPEAILGTNKHWGDVEWYNSMGWDKYLRADKFNPAEGYTTFKIDLTDIVRAGEVITQDDKVSWNKTYLSYFTYLQIDTQQMAEDFNISIPDEYVGMAGDYETGVIMVGGIINSEASFGIVDQRNVESDDTNSQCF